MGAGCTRVCPAALKEAGALGREPPGQQKASDASEEQQVERTATLRLPVPIPTPEPSQVVAEHFPMHTISVQTLMELKVMESFGSMRARGALGVAPPNAVVHFVSHEWLGFAHPDPDGVRLRRLQATFRAVMEGRISDLLAPSDWKAFSEKVSAGSLGKYREVEAAAAKTPGVLTEACFSGHVAQGQVWLDYSSIPQAVDFEDPAEAERPQQQAIYSIPAYLERCDYFWVMTPPARHADKGTWCNFTTWRSRGWCRLEEWGNLLSTTSCAPLIITHARQLSTIGAIDFMVACQGKPEMAPCAGAFTCCLLGHETVLPSGARRKTPCDRDFVLPVLQQLCRCKQRQLSGTAGSKSMHAIFCVLVLPMIFGGSDVPSPCSEGETIDEFMGRLLMQSVSEIIPPNLTVWHLAATMGHVAMLRKLLAEPRAMALVGGQPGGEGKRLGAELVSNCAVQGHIAALELLMGAGIVQQKDLDVAWFNDGVLPVDRAAKYGFPDMVRFLLQARAGIDCRRPDGATPLHGAAQAGHVGCCIALLDHAADVNPVDNKGRTPLHLAADPVTFHGIGDGKPAVLRVLLEHRADGSLRDGMGATALDIAAMAQFHEGEEVLQICQAAGPDEMN